MSRSLHFNCSYILRSFSASKKNQSHSLCCTFTFALDCQESGLGWHSCLSSEQRRHTILFKGQRQANPTWRLFPLDRNHVVSDRDRRELSDSVAHMSYSIVADLSSLNCVSDLNVSCSVKLLCISPFHFLTPWSSVL